MILTLPDRFFLPLEPEPPPGVAGLDLDASMTIDDDGVNIEELEGEGEVVRGGVDVRGGKVGVAGTKAS